MIAITPPKILRLEEFLVKQVICCFDFITGCYHGSPRRPHPAP
jgi:hypothetical protein